MPPAFLSLARSGLHLHDFFILEDSGQENEVASNFIVVSRTSPKST